MIDEFKRGDAEAQRHGGVLRGIICCFNALYAIVSALCLA